jgi:hypothetical protein
VLAPLLLVVLLGVAIFSLIGLLVGTLLTSEETTTLAGIILCVILFLFSSSIVPVESMGAIPRFFVQFNPFYLLEFLFRKVLIFGASPFTFFAQSVTVMVELVVMGAAVLFGWKVVRRRL